MLELFKLPYQIQVPDMLFVDELEADHGYLLEHGLQLGALSPASMAEVESLVIKYKQPSRYDCFALMLAKQEQCPLLTGDLNLRKAAEQEFVEVKGTLWVVESMVKHDIIDVEVARIAYSQMKQNGRRLPWDKAETRLIAMQAS